MRSKTVLFVTVLLLVLSLMSTGLLVGCGSGSEETTTTAASATTEVTPTTGGTSSTAGGTDTTATEAGSGEELGDFEFSLSMHDPLTSNNGQFYQAWADSILEATDGHVKIVIYPSSQLATAADVGEMVETGAVDIGWLYTSFYKGQFPLTDVTTVPMIGFKDAVVTANTLNDLYDKYAEVRDEWSRYKLLNLYGNPGMIFCCVDKPIKTPDDLKGLVMRTPAGPITDLVTGLGASPVVMPPPDMYEALSKGNINSYVFEPSGIVTAKLQEIPTYFTDMPLYNGAFGLVMNWDKWNSLPPEYQKIIEDSTGRPFSLAAAQQFTDHATKAHQIIADAGGTWITLTDEEKAAFQASAAEVIAAWPTTIEIDGFDAAAYMQDAISIAGGYSK